MWAVCVTVCKCKWSLCKVQFLCSQHITGAAAVISIPLNTPQPLFQADNYFQHLASVSEVELFHLLFIFWWPITVNVAYCSRECVRVCACVCTQAAYVAPALIQKHRTQPFAATS